MSPSNKELTPEEAATRDLLEQPQGPQYGITQNTPDVGFMGQYVIPAAAPTIGSMIGAATPIPGGAALGSMAGEGVNQVLGITEPSMTNLALAGAVPAAAGAATGLLGKMFGRKGAEVLNALAPEEAAMHLAKLEPQIASKYLFETATESGAAIPMARTTSALDSMIGELSSTSKGVQKANATALHYLKGLQEKLMASPHGLPPAALQRELAGAGEVMKATRSKGGAGLGAIKKVYGSMAQDLDDIANRADSVGTQAALTLKEARDTFKREAAIDEIQGALDNAFKVLRGQGDVGQFNAPVVLKELKRNEFVKQAFSPDEIKDMEKLFTKLNRIPALRPGAGQQAGSRSVLQGPLAGGSLGAAASTLTGMGPTLGGAVGAAAGVIVPPAAEMAKNIAVAMSMKTGRALLGQILKNSNGEFTPAAASIIGAYAEAVRAGAEGAVAP